MPRLDVQAVEEALGRWIQATWYAAPNEPIAWDGKTLRGARTGDAAAPHLLSFCTHQSQETFFEVRVSEKTHEILVAKDVVPTLPIAGRARPLLPDIRTRSSCNCSMSSGASASSP